MPVTLSIKNVPDDLAAGLRQRAAKNHRSLQGELMALIEHSLSTEPASPMTPAELLAHIRHLGVSTAADSTAILRADRDRDNHR